MGTIVENNQDLRQTSTDKTEVKAQRFVDGRKRTFSIISEHTKSDGFYCVCKQRDPETNPGNKPCPDMDKCHLCGRKLDEMAT